MAAETITIQLWKQDPIVYEIEHGKTPVVRWPRKLELEPLVHAMSQLPRWTGQTKKPYVVTEHAIRLRYIVNARVKGHWRTKKIYKTAALLHDLPECLGINDLQSKIKSILAPEIRELEEVVMQGLWDRFGPDYPECPLWPEVEKVIKPFDKELGDYEKNCLFTPDHAGIWHTTVIEFGTPSFELPEVMEKQWLNLYAEDVR